MIPTDKEIYTRLTRSRLMGLRGAESIYRAQALQRFGTDDLEAIRRIMDGKEERRALDNLRPDAKRPPLAFPPHPIIPTRSRFKRLAYRFAMWLDKLGKRGQ